MKWWSWGCKSLLQRKHNKRKLIQVKIRFVKIKSWLKGEDEVWAILFNIISSPTVLDQFLCLLHSVNEQWTSILYLYIISMLPIYKGTNEANHTNHPSIAISIVAILIALQNYKKHHQWMLLEILSTSRQEMQQYRACFSHGGCLKKILKFLSWPRNRFISSILSSPSYFSIFFLLHENPAEALFAFLILSVWRRTSKKNLKRHLDEPFWVEQRKNSSIMLS